MTSLQITLNLSPEVLERLQEAAEARNLSLDVVINDAIQDYFDEPTKEEILDTMRQSLREGLAGQVRPVDEVLAELKAELDANQS